MSNETQTERTKQTRSDSPTSSLQSLGDERSIDQPLNLRMEAQRNRERTKQTRSDSPTSSLQSLGDERSIDQPLNLRTEAQRNRERRLSLEEHVESTQWVRQQEQTDDPITPKKKTYSAKASVPDSQTTLRLIMESLVTEEFDTFKRELSEDYPDCLGSEPGQLNVSDTAGKIMESFGGETALRITIHFHKNGNRLKKIQDANKLKLKNKCLQINEGNSFQGKQSSLKEIYTDLYMTDGGSGEINKEHELLRIEISQSRITQEVREYACNDIFKTLPGEDKRVRTVLTMGIVGIGKHVSVQKFILDWAEGNANQDIEIIVHLLFRELNQRKESCSLVELVHQYAPELKGADLQKLRVLFILDGLEVCQYPLDFHKNDHCADINEKAPVDVLLTNLIQGNLFPSARLWITTRPSTSDRIPAECVHRLTEIRGFNDHQKDTYFRKKIRDQSLANKIIAHMKSCRSLYIMCHLPIFCWISATVLESVMRDGNSEESPRTLTEMFTHFLLIQISRKHKKFNGVEADNPKRLSQTDRTIILKLGELAFHQMEKGDLFFKEEDLANAGVEEREVSAYALCTEVFREELGLYRKKVYSFVHVSFQEYLAAVYAHFTCLNHEKNVLDTEKSNNVGLSEVHKTAVDQALKSDNGHLDLFLRFLLGLSVDYNCSLLKDLHIKGSSFKPQEVNTKAVNFIQKKIKQEQSPERIINLFHCLTELNDNSLVKEIQIALKSGTLLGRELEPEQWSAVAYVLLNSGEELEEFDMKKFQTSTANQLRLLPVLRICKKARLDCCNLSLEACGIVASALQSVNSPLRELDLKNNKLDVSGANVLVGGLKSPHCQVQKLGLAGCSFPSASCTNLASVVKSTKSRLTELDLSYNQIGGDGVKHLCNGLSQNRTLQKLMLKRCGLTKPSCVQLAAVLKSNTHLTELELKSNDLRDSGVKELSVGLEDPQCRLKRLGLSGCMVTEEGCRSLALALDTNPAHLEELDLSYNHPGDSGKKLLFDKKEDSNCKIKKLNFEKGGECRMKEGLRKYACRLTVDLNTIHPRLEVSNANRTISETTVDQHYPECADRFTLYPQAMCGEALTDRSYFEVDCDGAVAVGVVYKTADREESLMGVKNTLPSLLVQYGKLKLWQNNETARVFPVSVQSKRVGVYVDCEHGSLSYYSIRNGKLNHLHTHHTKFEHRLYTGFSFLTKSSVSLGEMK